MTPMTELVDLPDPSERPLVHPLDLREAGRLYRIAWLVGALTNCSVGLCLATIIWYFGRDYVGAIICFVAVCGPGPFVSRGWEQRAWEFIPRRRQDRQRPLPILLELGSALILAAMLAAALVLIALRLSQRDITPLVRDFIFGMGVAASLIALAVLVVRLARRAWWRRALTTVPTLLALVGCTAAANAILFAGAGPTSVTVALQGVAAMVLIGACWAVWTLTDRRRRRGVAAPEEAC